MLAIEDDFHPVDNSLPEKLDQALRDLEHSKDQVGRSSAICNAQECRIKDLESRLVETSMVSDIVASLPLVFRHMLTLATPNESRMKLKLAWEGIQPVALSLVRLCNAKVDVLSATSTMEERTKKVKRLILIWRKQIDQEDYFRRCRLLGTTGAEDLTKSREELFDSGQILGKWLRMEGTSEHYIQPSSSYSHLTVQLLMDVERRCALADSIRYPTYSPVTEPESITVISRVPLELKSSFQDGALQSLRLDISTLDDWHFDLGIEDLVSDREIIGCLEIPSADGSMSSWSVYRLCFLEKEVYHYNWVEDYDQAFPPSRSVSSIAVHIQARLTCPQIFTALLERLSCGDVKQWAFVDLKIVSRWVFGHLCSKHSDYSFSSTVPTRRSRRLLVP